MKKILIILIAITITTSSYGSNGIIENKGQKSEEILFYSELPGMNFFFKEDGLYFDFYKFHKVPNYEKHFKLGEVVKMNLKDSKLPSFEALNQVSYNNYFVGSEENWQKKVPVYETILLEEIYEDIDLRVYLDEGSPRYDFILRPGAEVSNIAYSFSGNHDFYIENDKVEIDLEYTEIVTTKLFAYQEINGQIKQIECKFVNKDGYIGFEAGNYNPKYNLVIDPVVYSTFFGGAGVDRVNDLTLVDDNNYIIAGTTSSSNFPVTEGVYQDFFQFGTDGFIAWYEKDGPEFILQFSTYIGGTVEDGVNGVDYFDEKIYIAGATNSTDFPTQDPLQQQNAGADDVFLCILNEDGSALLKSTYFGGEDVDIPHDIEVRSGDFHIVGETNSLSFPTENAFENEKLGFNRDAFVTKISNDLTFIEFSTYWGGSNEDVAYGLDVDQSGDIYFCGATQSVDMPVAPKGGFGGSFGDEPFDETLDMGWDMFLSKLTSDGGFLDLSSFYGGNGDDIAYDVAVDEDLSYFFVGESDSDPVEFEQDGLVISNDAYQPNRRGNKDIVFGKMSPKVPKNAFSDTQELLFSTFVGGSEDDRPLSLLINEDKANCLISGWTESSNFPTEGDEDSKFSGGRDGFLLNMSRDGSNLTYSYLIGGTGDDEISSSAFNELEGIIYGGHTNSQDFETTEDADQTDFTNTAGFFGTFVFGDLALTNPTQEDTYCIGNPPMTINWSLLSSLDDTDYIFELINEETGEVFTIQENYVGQRPYQWNISDEVEPGTYRVRITHFSGLKSISDEAFFITSSPDISSFEFLEDDDSYCIGDQVTIITETALNDEYEYTWYLNDEEINSDNSGTFIIESVGKEDAGDYKVEVSGECFPNAEDEVSLIVLDSTNISSQSDASISVMEGAELEIFIEAEGSNLTYQWFYNGNEILGEEEASITIEETTLSDAGTYYCVISGDCGENVQSDDISVTIEPSSVRNLGSKSEKLKITLLSFDDTNLELTVSSDLSGVCQVSVVDGLGKEVYFSSEKIKFGENRFNLNTNNLGTGVYYISILSSNEQATSKFIVKK